MKLFSSIFFFANLEDFENNYRVWGEFPKWFNIPLGKWKWENRSTDSLANTFFSEKKFFFEKQNFFFAPNLKQFVFNCFYQKNFFKKFGKIFQKKFRNLQFFCQKRTLWRTPYLGAGNENKMKFYIFQRIRYLGAKTKKYKK